MIRERSAARGLSEGGFMGGKLVGLEVRASEVADALRGPGPDGGTVAADGPLSAPLGAMVRLAPDRSAAQALATRVA
jgi:hypothetical protein